MESKKTVIHIIIFIIACFTCFCAGRFIRFKRTSRNSQQLESGILLTRNQVDTISNRLNIASSSIKSGADLEYAITKGIRELQHSNEVGILCINEIERTIENNQRSTEELKQSYNDLYNSTDYAIDLAIIHAREYERLIRTLQPAIADNTENAIESEPGLRNSDK